MRRSQHDGNAALHVACAKSKHHMLAITITDARWQVLILWNGVNVSTKNHSGGTAKIGLGDDSVLNANDLKMRQITQGAFDCVGNLLFMLGLAGNVHECLSQRHDVVGQGKPHTGTVSAVTSPAPVHGPASGVGLATWAGDVLLDVWFPAPSLGASPIDIAGIDRGADTDSLRDVRVEPVRVVIEDLQTKPANAADAYLRLHLLSARLVKPRTINLDGIFGLLTNVAWTNLGPVAIESVNEVRLRARSKGINLNVLGIDRFPRMIDYVVPTGVRIADADRVRLGAHLAEGTTVMHEGFVNFNAGTLGASMVEGRISAGVVVGNGSDIGGGASIMGTLSGGGTEVITIGERCLVGANAGVGISLGDDSVVEAGCYITAGSKITLPDGSVAKGKELSGAKNLLFRRNSVSGALEGVQRSGSWGGLNSALHAND